MFTCRSTSSTTRHRSVRLSPIAQDSRLRPPVGVWTVLSSIGGGQALTSPRRHSHGRPLPYHLADTPQAAPRANCSFTLTRPSGITPSFDELYQTLGCVPTYYYLVCHSRNWTLDTRYWNILFPVSSFQSPVSSVRLACLIHVASVHPELGSNS